MKDTSSIAFFGNRRAKVEATAKYNNLKQNFKHYMTIKKS